MVMRPVKEVWPELVVRHACVNCTHCDMDGADGRLAGMPYCNAPSMIEVNFDRVTGEETPKSALCRTLRVADTCPAYVPKEAKDGTP